MLYDQDICNYHSVHMCYSSVRLVLLNSHFEAYEDYVILSTLLLLPLSCNTSSKLHVIVATLSPQKPLGSAFWHWCQELDLSTKMWWSSDISFTSSFTKICQLVPKFRMEIWRHHEPVTPYYVQETVLGLTL